MTPEIFLDGDPEALDVVQAAVGATFDYAFVAARDHPGQWFAEDLRACTQSARFFARRGVGLDALLRSYRAPHAVISELVAEEVARLELDEQERALLLHGASLTQLAYIDTLQDIVAVTYAEELGRLSGDREQRRAALVDRVLAGHTVDGAELGYDLHGAHLAAIATGPGADDALRGLAEIHARPVLLVVRERDASWCWLDGSALSPAAWSRLLRARLPAGVRVAFGAVGGGVDGFRATHAQALAADRVLARRGGAVARYEDVMLAAAVLADETASRSLVELSLGPLLAAGERGEILTATLRAYLRCGQNATSAAAALGVHERTVRHRLRAVEELLGHPIHTRSACLEVALEVAAPGLAPPALTGRR